jgi:hypothetical protein
MKKAAKSMAGKAASKTSENGWHAKRREERRREEKWWRNQSAAINERKLINIGGEKPMAT